MREPARSIAVLPQSVSFDPSDQRRLLCPGCGRLFTTSSTKQTRCSLACAEKEGQP